MKAINERTLADEIERITPMLNSYELARKLMPFIECGIVKDAESAKVVAAIPQSVYDFARRCLHIAFVWNDHNFKDSPQVMARKECERYGITSFKDGNDWLDSPKDSP